MKRVGIVLAAGFFVLALTAPAQQHPGASPVPPAHHACVEEERQALEKGEGFGMALAADRHGFPGPKHILDLRAELRLTSDQTNKVQRLFDAMRDHALAEGKEVLAKEAELEAAFASATPDPGVVRQLVEESAGLKAELRWVHLEAHLAAYRVLTPEQRARYHELRYGTAAQRH